MGSPSYDDIQAGTEIAPRQYQVTRRDLVRYAGASGDFNVIHWNERVATSVGLPNVIAHGMLTMALAGRFVSDWAGDPGAVTPFGVRVSSPGSATGTGYRSTSPPGRATRRSSPAPRPSSAWREPAAQGEPAAWCESAAR